MNRSFLLFLLILKSFDHFYNRIHVMFLRRSAKNKIDEKKRQRYNMFIIYNIYKISFNTKVEGPSG